MAKKTREQINRERREKYAKGKAAGASRSQLRSVKKAAQADPSIGESLADIFSGIARAIGEGLTEGADDLLRPERSTKPTSKGKPASKGGGKGRGGKPPKGVPSFETFAKKRTDKAANEIIREYRKKYGKKGGKIGNERGKDIVRSIKGKEKQKEKATRIKYYGNKKNPDKKSYFKDRYMYKVKYQVLRAGYVEPSTEYATIATNRKYSKREIIDATWQLVDELQMQGKEKYNIDEMVDGSVEILYAIDTEK